MTRKLPQSSTGDKKPAAPAKPEAGASETFTRRQMASIVHAKLPRLTRRQSAELVESIIDEIVAGLVMDGEVRLQGFGVFLVRRKARRPGRNPRTGAHAEVSSRKSVVFRASPVLEDRLRQENASS